MLTRAAAQLLILVVLLSSACRGQSQQLPSSATGCSVGPPASSESISTLTAQQLAEGRLNTSVQSSWDFGVDTGVVRAASGVVRAASGRGVALACIIALNAGVSNPKVPGVFLQPTAIDLGNATGLSMENVVLSTSCNTVLEYQAFLCSSYSVAGSLTLRRGAVHFGAWRDGFTSLRNVTLTCPDPEAAAPLPCWLAAVQTVGELLGAFTTYEDAAVVEAANVTIVVAANISFTNGSWRDSPVRVRGHVQLVGSSRLNRPVLDLNLIEALWDVLPAASVTLVNLTCANLAGTYISPAHPSSVFALLADRVWAFRRTERQLHIIGSTLVVPREELMYMKRWLTYLTSPVPEDRAKAAWLNLIQIKVMEVNSSGIYYDLVQSYTTTYANVRLTDTLGPGYPLLPVNTGLYQALGEADSAVPLTAMRQILNASDLLIALSPSTMQPDSQGRRWLLLVANFSLADVTNFTSPAAAAGGTVLLPGDTVVGAGTGLRVVRLDFGGSPNSLGLPPGSTLELKDMTLGGLPALAAAFNPASPLDALVTPMWGVAHADASSHMRLKNVTVLVSSSELALLQQCLLPAGGAPALPAAAAASFDARLTAAVRAYFKTSRITSYGASYLRLTSGETQRYMLADVTFRTPVAADGEGGAPQVVAPPTPDAGRSGLEGWKIGVIVGCVGGVVLLALLAGALLAARWRRRRRQQYSGGDEEGDALGSGQAGFDKYRRCGGGDRASGGPSGGGSSEFGYTSHGLTNSSQVLQPDARRSDLEAAAAAAVAPAKAGTSSASCGIGNPGRSTSTTGGASQDTSSGAALLRGAAGAAGSASGSDGLRAAAAPLGPATASGGDGSHHGHSQVTDSFERPPSNTFLGQHGPAGWHAQRLGGTGAAGGVVYASTSAPSGSTLALQTQSILATGAAGALEQMHQMIQVLGRDFNDKQLEIHGLLGKGAHGTVYRGIWRGLPVAVKSMVFGNDSSARAQSRALMEAAISANLAHPNIVTSYSYELREVEHELASISPELARQGGGWRLLIIQEYCDAGPLRRLVDCGFFLTPPKPSSGRPRLKLPSVGLMRKDSPSGEGSAGSATRVEATAASAAASAAAVAATCYSRGSSGNSSVKGNGSAGRASPGREVAMTSSPAPPPAAAGAGGPSASMSQQPGATGAGAGIPKPALEPVPSDVPGRPASALQAARRYVEAALMIARGLQHIHDKNIVHGDLNPNNVLLMRAPGTPLGFCLKVADFGLSVHMSEGDSHMSNLFQGSPYYCAPEVVMSGKVGKSADIYSLGIMLWELQNGTRPPWRAGVRLRSYPSLNTAELDFMPETPPRYVLLARNCFHGSKDARPRISVVVEILAAIKAELDAM